MRYLTGLHEVGLYEAYRIGGLPPRTPKLMEGDRDLLLMFTLSRGPYTDAVLAFPIINDIGEWNTNWPLLPSFPLFWRNVLYTLGNIRDASAEENVQPGQVKTLKPGPGINKLQVTPPNNAPATQLDRGSRADFAFGGTDQMGVYSASWDSGSRRFAVNLLDADEGNLQPRPEIRIGAETVTVLAKIFVGPSPRTSRSMRPSPLMSAKAGTLLMPLSMLPNGLAAPSTGAKLAGAPIAAVFS